MENTRETGHMLDIWFFVSLVLLCYGLILIGTGIYYLIIPYQKTVLAHLHPNLWWGGIMFLGGIIFLWVSWNGKKRG